MLHTPLRRSVDIIFIHGLGGTSLRTWCWNRDLQNLWPSQWLPDESGLDTARILTFGYNAHFAAKKEQATLSIGDFASDLLFRMKYGESSTERLGEVPIVIVAHSMGGLVFKKAFIHGNMNEDFRGIVSKIKSVLFIATPHRGTDLADTLNKVLTSSVFGHSPKDYINELARKSPTIDELNETFRHHASKLQIFSFYETLTTAVGPMSLMILGKQSSVLGYPNEVSQPLAANHHDVCKFYGTSDPNYASVVGALRSAVNGVQSQDDAAVEEDLRQIQTLLGVSGPPEEDIAECRATRKDGTCKQFLASKELIEWRLNESSSFLWAHAPPGNGKSTLCSFVVDQLLEEGELCAYFFFKHDDRLKRSLGAMLRALSYQLAVALPQYRVLLADLARSGLQLRSSTAASIWKQLFVNILADVDHDRAIHWVLDGLDEAESSRQLLDFMAATADFAPRVRILAFSRPLPAISRSLQKLKKKLPVAEVALKGVEDDIRTVVAEEIEYLPCDDDFRVEIADKILVRSQGSFLWASLVLKSIVRCHRQEQVRKVLDTTPDGMADLYDRMMNGVAAGLGAPEDVALARILFSWATYARTPMPVEVLCELHATELASVMDLKHTIHEVCGQFVVLDVHNRLRLVHHSAKEYLMRSHELPFTLGPGTVHEDLLGKCFAVLFDRGLRGKVNTLKVPSPCLTPPSLGHSISSTAPPIQIGC